jgi:hypothetical protein
VQHRKLVVTTLTWYRKFSIRTSVEESGSTPSVLGEWAGAGIVTTAPTLSLQSGACGGAM